MAAGRTDVLQGTLELLVLRTLVLEPMHGWGLAQRIEMMSGEVFEIQQGTLYPALQRMKRKGWVQSLWRQTENNRHARYYSITATGRRNWRRSASSGRARRPGSTECSSGSGARHETDRRSVGTGAGGSDLPPTVVPLVMRELDSFLCS